MYCNNCNQNVPDGRFCKICGREVIRNKKIVTKQNGKLIVIAVLSIIISFVVTLSVVLMGATEDNGYSGPTSGLPLLVWIFIFGLVVLPGSALINGVIILLSKKNSSKENLCVVISFIFNLAIIIIPTVFFMLII